MLFIVLSKYKNDLKSILLIQKICFPFIGFFFCKKFKILFKPINIHILSWILNYIFGLIKGYKYYLELRGMGYKIKLLYSPQFYGINLRIGYSNIIYLKMLNFFRVYFFSKNSLSLYTNNLWTLNNYVQLFLNQKSFSPYKIKGFFKKNTEIKLKKNTKLRF